jgi:hypothetical protein
MAEVTHVLIWSAAHLTGRVLSFNTHAYAHTHSLTYLLTGMPAAAAAVAASQVCSQRAARLRG